MTIYTAMSYFRVSYHNIFSITVGIVTENNIKHGAQQGLLTLYFNSSMKKAGAIGSAVQGYL